MAKQIKNEKSARLKELEDVFERRTRRFSPFEVLGLKSMVEGETDTTTSLVLTEHSEKSENFVPPANAPVGGSDPPISGPTRPTPGGGHARPGVDIPTKVVVEEITTTYSNPPIGGSDPPISSPTRPTSGPISESNNFDPRSLHRASTINNERYVPKASPLIRNPETTLPRTLSSVADIVAATQVASQIGPKARNVLAYLNSIRSLEYESYTVPVGYGQISSQVGVDSDYLRRKALPKLAMLGFIAIARKNLEGTVYHLLHDRDYISAVTGDSLPVASVVPPVITSGEEVTSDSFSWPEWVDKEQWGWLSRESIQRLVQKAGSEAQAREKLAIIVYNEVHGDPHKRVRNRRSVLAHYLSTPQAEIWPNDDGFETLAMRQTRLEREQAQKEKALAEDLLRAKREAQKARFSASLSDSQIQWIKQEARRTVDSRPEAKMLTSRFPLYKAEEDQLLEEWMERVGYGDTVPSFRSEHS